MSAKHKLRIRVDQKLLREHQKLEHDFFLEHATVYDLFSARAEEFPNKIFAIFPEYKKEYTYGELKQKVDDRAAYFEELGIKKGQRIAFVLRNSPDFVMLYLAALKKGIVVVTVNPDLSQNEIVYVITNSDARAVFYSEHYKAKIAEVRLSLARDDLLFIDATGTLSSGEVTSSIRDAVSYIDEAVIIYTSGTTGNPKGVVLTHLNLLADSQAIAEWFQFTSDVRTLCILPLFHNNGQVITLFAPLQKGGSTVIVSPKASLKEFWKLIATYGVSWTSVMPSILSIVLSLRMKREDSTMAGIICGGQVLNAEVKKQFEDTFHVPIFEGFGLTETTSFACFNQFPTEKRKLGSVGRALPCNAIKIIDNELCVRGLNVMNEYYALPEVNKKALRDGWFHTGDFGEIDGEGNVYFRTRKDYLIIKGGENIYPSEIENVLFAHPGVDECAVIGVPDALLGQNIVAFVQANEPQEEGALKGFLIGKLANYKHPKRIFIVNELGLGSIPKGPTKKVLYRSLLAYYNEHLRGE